MCVGGGGMKGREGRGVGVCVGVWVCGCVGGCGCSFVCTAKINRRCVCKANTETADYQNSLPRRQITAYWNTVQLPPLDHTPNPVKSTSSQRVL